MDARQVARAGVTVALLAVSSWVSIPFGPVPFTLQTLALAVVPAAFDRATAMLAIVAYILLGAVGLPVFAGFSGGPGALMGPTGGFLWGFVLGMLAATTFVRMLPKDMPGFARVLAADAVMLLISYVGGTLQLMAVGSMGLLPALTVAVIPFVVPDIVKLVVGARIGCAVARTTARRPK